VAVARYTESQQSRMRGTREFIFANSCNRFCAANVDAFRAADGARRERICSTTMPARHRERGWMSALDNDELEAVLQRIASGDMGAFDALYAATLPRVLALATGILGSESAAEDCAAETYIQVWRSAKMFDAQRGPALAWLHTICRTRALDQLRARQRRDALAGAVRQRACVDHGVDALGAAIEVSASIAPCLERLSVTQRELLALAFFQGMSHAEIAAATQLPIGSVKSHIHRAVTALRARLGDVGAQVEQKEVQHG
jgi:RNA polymerase sigma-70 factor (ECF subfamily)